MELYPLNSFFKCTCWESYQGIHSAFLIYSDPNFVFIADHTHLEGGQVQEGGHLLAEELHQDECLLHQGIEGVDLQWDGEGFFSFQLESVRCVKVDHMFVLANLCSSVFLEERTYEW